MFILSAFDIIFYSIARQTHMRSITDIRKSRVGISKAAETETRTRPHISTYIHMVCASTEPVGIIIAKELQKVY